MRRITRLIKKFSLNNSMATFFCKNCSFKYTPKRVINTPPRTCTNCGAIGSLQKEPSAEDILNESDYM